MLSTVEFTDSDLKANTLVDPAWYTLDIGQVTSKVSAKGDSTNYTFDAVVKCATADGDTTYEGVPVQIRVNSKLKGAMMDLLRAGGIEIVAGTQYAPEDMSGKTISAHITTSEWQGRMRNEVQHRYRTV